MQESFQEIGLWSSLSSRGEGLAYTNRSGSPARYPRQFHFSSVLQHPAGPGDWEDIREFAGWENHTKPSALQLLRTAYGGYGGAMIRLAIPENSAVCHDVARRLRGVTVAWGAPTSSDVPPPASCDAIVCLAPARCDARWIERCLAAKKHVLVDAQAWLSAIELETLIAAAQRSDVQLAIENPDRFLPSRQLIRQQLDAGKIGTPGLVRLHRWVPAHADEEVAAGGLPMALIRDIEVVLSLVGTSPNSVYAVERPQPFPPAPGRVLQVHLGFPSGAMALIDYAHCLPAGDDYRSLSVIGSTGAAYADDHHNVQLLYHGGSPQAIRVGEGSRHLVAMVQEFVDCLTADRDRWASAGIWRQVFDVAELAGQALATRQAFELKGA